MPCAVSVRQQYWLTDCACTLWFKAGGPTRRGVGESHCLHALRLNSFQPDLSLGLNLTPARAYGRGNAYMISEARLLSLTVLYRNNFHPRPVVEVPNSFLALPGTQKSAVAFLLCGEHPA